MEASKEKGSQPPEKPILCVNNCGFFGTAETMNMCSKCYKDMILKHGLEKLAETSIGNIVHGGSGSTHREAAIGNTINLQAGDVESKISTTFAPGDSSSSNQDSEVKVNVGPNRCCSCGKRVGLTGFSCRGTFSDRRPVPYDRKYHAAYWAMQERMLYFPSNMDDHKDAEIRATNSASPDKEADYKLSILRACFSRVGVWWNGPSP
ncbi:hypothetical protein ACET3Z_019211 [Daucus carota]